MTDPRSEPPPYEPEPGSNVVPMRRDEPEFRAPPQNVEAEQELLGSIMVRNTIFDRVAFLEPRHFALPVHGRIFAAIGKLIGDGRNANPLTLKGFFGDDAALGQAGGDQYLVRVAASGGNFANAVDYARTINECWLRRELIAESEWLRDAAFAPDIDTPAEALIAQAEQRLYDLADASPQQGGPKPIAAGLAEALADTEAARRGETAASVKTGLVDLDRVIGGLRAPRLYILAGRPAMGKSTVAKTIALAAARAGVAVLFFSMEMSKKELSWWLLADITGIAASRQESGEVTEQEFERLIDAKETLALLPLHIDDTAELNMAQIRGRARKFLRRAKGPVLIVADHLGLIQASDSARQQGATAEVTEVTRALKVLSKDLDAPVIALCQLNRQLEQRDDKRPNLADLRQSGSIEQDADAVIFVFRAEYYLTKEEPQRKASDSDDKFAKRLADWHAQLDRVRGLAQLIVAKQRGGPEGMALVKWDPERSRVVNLARGGIG